MRLARKQDSKSRSATKLKQILRKDVNLTEVLHTEAKFAV